MALPETRRTIAVAAALVSAGLLLVLLGWAFRRYRLLAVTIGLGLTVVFAPSFGLLLVSTTPTTFYLSPMPYTAQSIARGGALYQANCVPCHGVRGKGDGPAAASLAVRPADLTASHVLAHSEGDEFWWLGAGIPRSGMPGFAGLLSEDERWDLVNWVRTLPVGGLDEGLMTEVGGGTAPRAPDFTFTQADGTSGSLQERLAGGPLLLVFFSPGEGTARLDRLNAALPTLASAGLGVLAIPLGDGGAPEAAWPGFVVAADPSAASAYRLLAAIPNYDLAMSTGHLEFLLDGQGYVRAVWLPAETSAWDDVASLVKLVGQLATRPLTPQAMPMHQHVMQ